MELLWYGNASIVLREGDAALCFDPFGGIRPGELKRPPEHIPYEEEFRKLRHIFVTHGHFDHIGHLPRLYKGTDAAVYCTAAPAATLRKKGLEARNLVEIRPGWEGTVGPFTVRAYQGRHCKFDLGAILHTVFQRRFFRYLGHMLRLLSLLVTYKEKGEILFYEIECNGVRVQLMGSMNLDRDAVYPTGADLLVLPLQGRSDQDTYALRFVERLRPKCILLDHFDDAFPPMTQEVDLTGFVRGVEAHYGIPCRIPDRERPVHIEI